MQGAVAVVLTTAERARDLKPRPAYLAGYGQRLAFAMQPRTLGDQFLARLDQSRSVMTGGGASEPESEKDEGDDPERAATELLSTGTYGAQADGLAVHQMGGFDTDAVRAMGRGASRAERRATVDGPGARS